ncbi:hypothetical protein B0H17DRAFT_1188954 [Mycena rosella]|uniref:Uncharacterized protein n=1 Tax=Mycena rosella TaxID=1033263 RepID=A0AAD7FEY5_MYCRO|nr:hypothetical protein B0H17DRAFT_1188954 [Mycena rosella]
MQLVHRHAPDLAWNAKCRENRPLRGRQGRREMQTVLIATSRDKVGFQVSGITYACVSMIFFLPVLWIMLDVQGPASSPKPARPGPGLGGPGRARERAWAGSGLGLHHSEARAGPPSPGLGGGSDPN